VPPAPAREEKEAPPPGRKAEHKPEPTGRKKPEARVTLAPNTPAVNLAIRVRRPLDDRLVEIIHTLRREDVRTSKVELIEMLLWELPETPDDALRRRLSSFRRAAPRGSGSSAEL
jgi:hypothetical protein